MAVGKRERSRGEISPAGSKECTFEEELSHFLGECRRSTDSRSQHGEKVERSEQREAVVTREQAETERPVPGRQRCEAEDRGQERPQEYKPRPSGAQEAKSDRKRDSRNSRRQGEGIR